MAAQLDRASILTSLALSIVVVSVFAVLRNRGPQSTVSRYFEAVRVFDSRTEGEVLLQDVTYPDADQFRAALRTLGAEPAKVEIQRAFVLGRKAVVDAEFTRSDYGHYVVRLILTKPRIFWKVDAKASWDYLNQAH